VASESEAVLYAHNIFAVFVIVFSQRLQNLNLDFALLVQLFPVFEDFESYCFFGFVIEAPEDDAKGTAAQLFLDLISVVYLIFDVVEVVGLIVVEAMVVDATIVFALGVFILAGELALYELSVSLVLGVQV